MEKIIAALVGLAFISLAGCIGNSGKDDADGRDGIPATAEPGTFDAETGAIDGIVLGDDQLPLPGVQLAILEADLETDSAQDGSFSFSQVAPGQYRLAAALLGYEDVNVRVDVVAGQSTETTLRMDRKPVVFPHRELLQFEGRITCSVGTAGVISEECGQGVESPTGGRVGQDPQNQIDWLLNVTTIGDLKTIYFELDWTPASAAARQLGFHVAHGFSCIGPCHEDIAYCEVWDNYGPPVVGCEIDIEDLGVENVATDLPWDITARAWAAPSAPEEGANIVLQQGFTMYATFFYGEPMPDGYTAVIDA